MIISGVGKRIFFWIVIVLIIPFSIINLVVYHQEKEQIRAQIYNTLNTVADVIESQALFILNNKKNRVQDFSSDGFIRNSLEKINRHSRRAGITGRLNRYLIKNKKPLDNDILDIFIFDRNGNPVASTNEERLKAKSIEPDYFTNAKRNVTIGTIENKYADRYFAVSGPLMGTADRNFIGVITVIFKASAIDNILTGAFGSKLGAKTVLGGFNKKGNILVIDRNKTVLSANGYKACDRRFRHRIFLPRISQTDAY